MSKQSKSFPALTEVISDHGIFFVSEDAVTLREQASAELKAAEELPTKLRELADRWRKEHAHTYSSENADHYRGFDAGRLRSAEELEAVIAACERKP